MSTTDTAAALRALLDDLREQIAAALPAHPEADEYDTADELLTGPLADLIARLRAAADLADELRRDADWRPPPDGSPASASLNQGRRLGWADAADRLRAALDATTAPPQHPQETPA